MNLRKRCEQSLSFQTALSVVTSNWQGFFDARYTTTGTQANQVKSYLTMIYLRYILRTWLNRRLRFIATVANDASTNGYHETRRMNRVCVRSAKAPTGIVRERERQRSKSHSFSANFDADLLHSFLHLGHRLLCGSYVRDDLKDLISSGQSPYKGVQAAVAKSLGL